MPNFRRYYIPNALVFITVVSQDRISYLGPDENAKLFFETLYCVKEIHPFRLLAYVILPEHFHWLMHVEDDKGNFSTVLHSVKRNYTLNFKKAYQISTPISLWQNRFWDHVIRNEQDLSNHFDYIHYNPVKHRLVKHPENWRHSTFSFWYERGYYPSEWGWMSEPENIVGMDLA